MSYGVAKPSRFGDDRNSIKPHLPGVYRSFNWEGGSRSGAAKANQVDHRRFDPKRTNLGGRSTVLPVYGGAMRFCITKTKTWSIPRLVSGGVKQNYL